MDTTSGEKLGKSPERRNYMVLARYHSRTEFSGKDAWYEGAGIYRSGVSLHGT